MVSLPTASHTSTPVGPAPTSSSKPAAGTLADWKTVRKLAPPLTVVSSLPQLDQQGLARFAKRTDKLYRLLKELWVRAPMKCQPQKPVCAKPWRHFEKVYSTLLGAIQDLEPLCGWGPNTRTAVALRTRAHSAYLSKRMQQLSVALDKREDSWGPEARKARMEHSGGVIAMRPCLSCIAPGPLALVGVVTSFERNSSRLDDADRRFLDRIADTLNQPPTGRLEIRGHADPNESDPAGLARDRANEVVKYLVGRGVANNLLVPRSFAANLPVDRTQGDFGKLNRRVDFETP